MTERLYYRDPALLSFEAVVMRVEPSGELFHVFLDRSAFYPSSGGQLYDTGTLGGTAVIEVLETPDGDVAHVLATTVPTGARIKGEVDAARRRRHSRQHTAQHILSAVLTKLYVCETVSVHLGDDYGTVELDSAVLSDDQLKKVQQECTGIIDSNCDIEIVFAEGEEITSLPLRKPPSREGTIRVIRIGEVDWSACGGTHCRTTAEVGVIRLVGQEKLRGHAVIKFLAGEQALDDYALRADVTDKLAVNFTCNVRDLPGKIEKLTNENKELRRSLAMLQQEVIPVRAQTIAARANIFGKWKIAMETMNGLDGTMAGKLAGAVADEIGGLALLMVDGRLIIAVSATTSLKAGQLARLLAERTGLKGGGSDHVAQLGGAQESRLTEYRDLIIALAEHA